MLTFWIPDGPCMLPANASHQVGVGGFVINDKNEVSLLITVICYKYSSFSLEIGKCLLQWLLYLICLGVSLISCHNVKIVLVSNGKL